MGLSFERKPSVGRRSGVAGPAKCGWTTPGVVGKSLASVRPDTTILPAASMVSALIVLVPNGICKKPYQVPPKNVDHRRPLPPAFSCVTKPLLAYSWQRLAHERGLGCGDVNEIDIVGDDISDVNFHFDAHQDTLASRGQKMIYWGALKPLEHLLLRTPLAPWSYIASRLYHDVYWYNCVGRRRVRQALQTEWGKLFTDY